MSRARVSIVAVVVLVAFGVLQGCGGSNPSLKISINGLPQGQNASVSITGPRGDQWHVTGSAQLLGLEAGGYKVVAHGVHTSAGVFWPNQSETLVRLGSTTRAVTVDYDTFVPDTTRVVPGGATKGLSPGPSKDYFLAVSTLPGDRPYAKGQDLASGPTPDAPDGYLVKVARASHERNNEQLLEVIPTDLVDALPEGDLVVPQQKLDVGISALSFSSTALTCTSGGTATVSGSMEITPAFSVRAKWAKVGFLTKIKRPSFDVHAALESMASVTVVASASASCKTEHPGIPLLQPSGGIRLGHIVVPVAHVPVVIVPVVQAYLYGSANIEGSVTAGLTHRVNVGVDLRVGRKPQVLDKEPLRSSLSASVDADAPASFEVAVLPTVKLLMYGLAGPSLNVGGGVKLTANPVSSPRWTLEACVYGGGSVTVPILRIHKGNPRLLSTCRPVATSRS